MGIQLRRTHLDERAREAVGKIPLGKITLRGILSDEEIRLHFGERVRHVRKAKGLSQEALVEHPLTRTLTSEISPIIAAEERVTLGHVKGDYLLNCVNELQAVVPRYQWHFLPPVPVYFAEFEYRRDPTTFLRARAGASNGKRRGTEGIADALESFWLGSVTATDVIANSLRMLSEGCVKAMMPATYRLSTTVLSELDQVETIRAFTRASEECRFWPSPAILREFSGRVVSGDPVRPRPRRSLLKLLAGMRTAHGPMLKPLPGKVLLRHRGRPEGCGGVRNVG